MSKPGRNDPCPCGSGRKYKQCCLNRNACSQAPSRPPVTVDEAQLLQAMQSALASYGAGDISTAEARCRQILQLMPTHPDALHLLGLIAHGYRRYEAAVDLIGRAVRVRDNVPAFHVNLGRALAALKRTGEAMACYRRALALDPDLPEANSNLGGILANLHQLDEAVTLCRRALDAKPKFAAAWSNLGIAYYHQRNYDLAIDSCEQALALQPDSIQALHILGASRVMQGRIDEGIASLEQALALRPDYARAHGSLLFALLYRAGTGPEELFGAHRRYAEQIESPLRPAWPQHANDRDPDRRLRIGYVSPDFRNHSVAYFAEPLLAHHDRAAFEIFAYYNHYTEDEFTGRIRACVDHWLPCAGLSDDALAERIQADGIDILVDLAGHSGRNRLPVFARKPAPVQVTWLGYPTTTGLTAIDWRLTTHDVDPDGSEAYHSERLWYLPRSLWCYRPGTDSVVTQRQAGGDSENGEAVVFGSMNSFAKVSPETVAVWARILRELPASRLIMTHVPEGVATQLLLERFAEHGITPERLDLHGRLPVDAFRDLTRRIDIALDPFPYNGTTTTCESLWLGIPVITLTGTQSVSRSGYALLHMVGLDSLCASDEDDYVRIATSLAQDRARLNELHAGLHQRLENSPLRDEQGFAREVEEAFRRMWRQS